jgi:hypothetical protein
MGAVYLEILRHKGRMPELMRQDVPFARFGGAAGARSRPLVAVGKRGTTSLAGRRGTSSTVACERWRADGAGPRQGLGACEELRPQDEPAWRDEARQGRSDGGEVGTIGRHWGGLLRDGRKTSFNHDRMARL